MEEAAAAALLQVLFETLKNEASLVRDFRREADQLSENLETIQKFLNDAEMRSIPDESFKKWLLDLGDVGFDADNVLDEIKYHQLSKQSNAMIANKTMKQKLVMNNTEEGFGVELELLLKRR
ncbi:disease resistance RPP13-like protein 4 isoform X2 [Salvia hispanica]|uniref:disease resistance RPP13-like protein 4 isoform X2 n=1 Tax=Salvia hispanica TaxID=49212 RepID=UPI002008FED7|nr:disease resistance RPP13-like protein 4 isoform X2 [Salvia hispanica]